MRRITTDAARGAFLATLSIGEKLKVERVYADGHEPENVTFDAEVLEHDDDKTVVQVANDLPGGQIVGLTHNDGESLLTTDGSRSCWYAVAAEQPDHVEPERKAESITAVVEGPGTQVAINGPKSVSWFLEQAKLLDDEAEKYRQYTPPHTALTSAAASLRSAVGHVLQGGHEKQPNTKPAPF